MSCTRTQTMGGRRGGFVMISVLFVLVALLLLCAPFLATARNANHHSQQLAVKAQLRLAHRSAAHHARHLLQGSHPGNPDETPYFDDLEELAVPVAFDSEFLNPTDPKGVMWDLEVADVSGFIDLNSASPMVIANVLDMTTRLTDVVDGQAGSLPAKQADGFSEEGGYLWMRGELIRYGQGGEDGFGSLERGIGTSMGAEDSWMTDGPRPPSGHGVGTHVIDQRAFAPAIWRVSAEGEPREFDSFEQLIGADKFALAGEMGPATHMTLSDHCTVHAGVRAGDRWQRPVRLTNSISGGETLTITVDDPRYINAGSTIMIDDGEYSELRLVQGLSRGGGVRLEYETEQDYDAWKTVVKVLRRRPVNVNTAPRRVLRALFLNVQLRGRNDRITTREADGLADLVVESRPFTGFEDFMRRVVLPSAGLEELPDDAPVVPESLGRGSSGLIDSSDAVAIYLNALNANDAYLEFGTMPFCFVSRDTYRMDLRASVNGKSGVERSRGHRERVELVVPQRELFSLWSTQEDFDEACRLTRTGAWWATGPASTTRYDGSAVPPSRAWPHMGTLPSGPYLPGFHEEKVGSDGEGRAPVHTFASREGEDDFAQLWAARVQESGARSGRMLHFDHETNDPEGRYLPEQRVFRAADDQQVQWVDGGLAKALSFEMWVKPQEGGDGVLLDLGGTSPDVDRVTLLMEGEDLVLRVLDGFGDHRDSVGFSEATEARLAIAQGDGPGLPPETWSHLAIDVQGTRPDQVDLMVNGMSHGVRRLGMSRLSSAASQGDGTLLLEDTEGFPPRGVVRIGNELIEYVLSGDGLQVAHLEAGPDAGHGGRIARERWSYEGLPMALESLTLNHPAGTMVEVYGYSIPFTSEVPGGTGDRALTAPLGSWKVARVTGTETGQMDPILAGLFYFGLGYEATNTDGLTLALADDSTGEVMDAFHPDGGYAMLIQQRWAADQTGASANPPNAPLGGFEIVRYSGYSGDVLYIAARGDEVMGELPRYAAYETESLGGGTRAFVIDWESTTVDDQGTLAQEDMGWGMYAVPISLSVPGATLIDFLEPEEDRSEFAQITRTDQAEMTEWVRYDTVQEQQGQLVRDHPGALTALYATITGGRGVARDLTGSDPGGGGPGGPGGPGGGGGGGGPGGPPLEGSAPAAPPRVQPAAIGADWDPYLGESEIDDLPLTRAAWSAFQFRGVLETQTHAHEAGALVTPVFNLPDRGVDGGRPGARDEVFLVGPDVGHLGWPMVVHRVHLPAEQHVIHTWEHIPGEDLVATAGPSLEADHGGFQRNQQFVALQSASPEPFVGSGPPGQQGQTTVSDPRLRARMVKWPSGERPRTVGGVTIGGELASDAGVPGAVIDEVLFGSPQFLTGLPGAAPATYTQAASMRLREPASEGTDLIEVAPTTYIAAGGLVGGPLGTLAQLPDDAGILRLGDELMCYDTRSPETGELTIAPGGRGLLGTLPAPHALTSPVAFLEHYVVSTLNGGVGPADSTLAVANANDFPSRGLVLVGDELIHYTRRLGNRLDMPRTSDTPGAMDGGGRGMFRGRFGTTPTSHAAGTPVILFPFRYWDRWEDEADAPELAYMGFELEQPGAWWKATFWDAEEASHGQAHVQVLMRTDPTIPWDEDPDAVDGLTLMTQGREDNDTIPISGMSDRAEWRVFVRYDPGAFDPFTGASHGWKETPRFRRVGVEYYAPGMVLRSVDR